MRRTIFLHIGHFKTGTTALQLFAKKNSGVLKSRGVSYARENLEFGKHSRLAFAVYHEAGVTELMHGYSQNISADAVWGGFFDEVRASSTPAVLASTEELMRLGAHPNAIDILKKIIEPVRDEFDFKIIAYLRPPQQQLQSWHNQLVKMNKMTVPDFNRAVCDLIEPIHYDYSLAVQPWIDFFGKDAVILRPYTDELRLGNALFEDFMSVLGLKFAPRMFVPEKDPNPRISDDYLELTRILQSAGLESEELDWAHARLKKMRGHLPTADSRDFDIIISRTKAGLESLKGLPGNGIDVDAFGTALPELQEAEVANLMDIIVVLLSDVRKLRKSFYSHQVELKSRVDKLEAAHAALLRNIKDA